MTDASPVNRYLLFARADDLQTCDKINYALLNGPTARGAPTTHGISTQESSLGTTHSSDDQHCPDRNVLIRTLDELKRGTAMGTTPSTGGTFTGGFSSIYTSPETGHAPTHFGESADTSPVFLDDTDGIDSKPWDNTGAQTDLWSWPIEVLYQSYNVIIAIDFGQATFTLSRNGEVFADRIPTIVSSLLEVIETTLTARQQDTDAIKAWLQSNIADEAVRERLLSRVWNPTILVSILLLNAPRSTEVVSLFNTAADVSTSSSAEEAAEEACSSNQVPLFSPEHTRFSAFDARDGEESTMSTGITILSRQDARAILRDADFIERLSETLLLYENVCRERTEAPWPESHLSSAMEYLIRTSPESAKECHSIVVVTNVLEMSCLDTFSFLESVVRRKNLIMSLVTLNRLISFDSPQLSPLSQFLASVGGFAVNIDYWLALSAAKLNSDWCRRFEGARCLAQQLFVHLVSHFPVCSPGIMQRYGAAETTTERVVLYDSEKELHDFVISASTWAILRAVAIARFNEGWSVLIDYKDESSGALAARYNHNFHKGKLTLHYEMDINRPAVYRRLEVSGTKALVEHFLRMRPDDHVLTVLTESNVSWLAYLTLLRLQLHSWVRAEQALLKMVNLTPKPATPVPSMPELSALSSFDGLSSEWMNFCAVSSFAVFFRYEDVSLPLMWNAAGRTANSSSASSIALLSAAVAGKAVLRAALLKKHHAVLKDDMTFLGVDADGCPEYLVQVFPLQDAHRVSEATAAGGFECRVNFFSCVAAEQRRILVELSDVIAQTSAERRAIPHGSPELATVAARSERKLLVSVSPTLDNHQALLLVVSTVSPRRMELLSRYAEALSPYGMYSPHRGELQSVARERHASFLRGKNLLVLLQKSLSTPLSVFPWALANAVAHRWCIGYAELSPSLAEDSFCFMVMRRIHDGFKLLMCNVGSLKAVLHQERRDRPEDMLTSIFDVIEADQVVSIYRLITPYKRLHKNDIRAITDDVQDDLHIATALYSYKVFSTQTGLGDRVSSGSIRDVQRRASTVVGAKVESLLRYLEVAHSRTIDLQSPASLGATGACSLRKKIVSLLEAMGDHSVFVTTSSLRPDYAQLLSLSSDPIPDNSQVAVTTFYPIRYQTIIFLLVLVDDTPGGVSSGVVRVSMAFMDAALLHYGLGTRLFTKTPREGMKLPDCNLDMAVVQSLRRMITSFASVYITKQLLDWVRERPEASSPEDSESEEQILKELSRSMGKLRTYATEIDVTHVWYVIQSRYGVEGSAVPPLAALEEVVTGIVLRHARPFLLHPSLLLPTWSADEGEDSVGGKLFSILPMMMKVCVSAPSQEEASDESCFWVAKKPVDSALLHDTTIWSPMDKESVQRDDPFDVSKTSPEVRLRIFIKTVPIELLDLCRDASFALKPSTVRNVLRNYVYQYNSRETPMHQADGFTPFVDGTTSGTDSPLYHLFETDTRPPMMEAESLFNQCHSFSKLPETFERVLRSIANVFSSNLATYSLQSTFSSTSFAALRDVVSQCGSPEVADEHSNLLFLSHTDTTLSRGAQSIPGLLPIVRQVVEPALLSSSWFLSETFPVEFTQQSTTYLSVDPIAAALDVFRRCVEEDHMCVLQATQFSYVFVPNASYFSTRWAMVRVEMVQDGSSHLTNGGGNKASILCFDPDESNQTGKGVGVSSGSFSARLRSHIYNKVTQVSQLNLLKQLRDTQNASTELIPAEWGDQFQSTAQLQQKALPIHRRDGGDHHHHHHHNSHNSSTDAVTCSSSFYLRGENVLEIPIYYKLQHKCKNILAKIATNCARLELIQIYNREQCYVVADDEEGDTFHYIRLVFVKDLTHSVTLTEPSPQVLPADRCPQLVVQLFTATTNASVKRPLQKLQDFAYFLAVQELQGQLNYMQHRLISFNDLIFLQNQRLSPIVLNLHELPYTMSDDDTLLAMALLFLNLRENKFKLFNVQSDEYAHATSNFVDHYNLEQGPKQNASIPQHGKGTGDTKRILRFVRIADGLTDVLLSCALRLDDEDERIIVVERYLTKIPTERYINGESEKIILKHLSDHMDDTVGQILFHALSTQRENTSLSNAPHLVKGLLNIAEGACRHDSSMLKDHTFSLDEISPAVLPYLVERLCAALSIFAPMCYELTQPRGPQPIRGFSWQWMEKMQNNPCVQATDIYITCGYTMTDEGGEPIGATRAVPVVLSGLSLTSVTVDEAQSAILKEHTLSGASQPAWRILLKVSLREGVRVVIFNLRDADTILRVVSDAIQIAEEKSALMGDVLMQRLGYGMPTSFAEEDLARHCCGDASNVLMNKPLSISSDVYRRRVNHVRYRPHQDEPEEILAVIIEGLYNRGLMVNYTFATEDAMKVVFDEYADKSLGECADVLMTLLKQGALEPCVSDHLLKPQVPFWRTVHHSGKEDAPLPFPLNCRLVETGGVPVDALVACDYHRHVVAAHIIVEAQNARSEVAEVLARCDALWRAGPHNNVLELARSVVSLQAKSKEVFGARVPDFTLRRECWGPEDDILDPTLPSFAEQNPGYTQGVNAALKSYMGHIRQLYPSLCMIDLDPNDPTATTDPVLLSRLRCRYGKATSGQTVTRFTPHLYYAVIPFVDVLRCKGMSKRYSHVLDQLEDEALSTPITTSGLFIVEVGLQVVHYALDFFVINGSGVPLSIAAQVAAEFKQSLAFDSILYDTSVRQVMQSIRNYSQTLPGQQEPPSALANLVKYYPSPPVNSVNIAAVFRITDPRVMRLKNLPRRESDSRWGKDLALIHPEGEKLLVRDRTGEAYVYCGVILWDTAQLFVLLATEKETSKCVRCPNEDLQRLVGKTRRRLLEQLLHSTEQERLDAAFSKFLCASIAEAPVYDEYDLLLNNTHKIELPTYRSLLQRTLQTLEWSGDGDSLTRLCRKLCPNHVARVLWKASAPSSTNSDSASRGAGALTGAQDVASAIFRSGIASGRLTITFAPNDKKGGVFLAMECWSVPSHMYPFSVQDVSLYRKVHDTHSPSPAYVPLSGEELSLIDTFVRFIVNAVWVLIIPCSSELHPMGN